MVDIELFIVVRSQVKKSASGKIKDLNNTSLIDHKITKEKEIKTINKPSSRTTILQASVTTSLQSGSLIRNIPTFLVAKLINFFYFI